MNELTNNEIMTIKLTLMNEIRNNDFLINKDVLKETYLKKNTEIKTIIDKLNMLLLNNREEK
ncbi:hypothetical protein [Clostridium neonatale]|uniref:hypothetical protein n=1 Tax=Clostridium neonatale TaxID=137838 RepID=UPI00291BECFA|nr:hypothetical protein [Clostridium neonatale]CAI3193037.1 hypothetical protein CNEO2_130102 [Clostridium neonatale]CAI3197066.1 hypothetical protein CNEO2_160039 [Clostridium neonatale]